MTSSATIAGPLSVSNARGRPRFWIACESPCTRSSAVSERWLPTRPDCFRVTGQDVRVRRMVVLLQKVNLTGPCHLALYTDRKRQLQ